MLSSDGKPFVNFVIDDGETELNKKKVINRY